LCNAEHALKIVEIVFEIYRQAAERRARLGSQPVGRLFW
jgi:hypothetical protein